MELTPETIARLAACIELRRQAELGIIDMDTIVDLETNGGAYPAPTFEDLDHLTVSLIAK